MTMSGSSSIDINQVRNDTLGCKNIIHFNNAGAALTPKVVSQCLHDYLHQEEAIGGYETQAMQVAALGNFYQAAARLLNCDADEIAFAQSATSAWGLAFYGLSFQAGDKILTTYSEYGSNMVAYLQQARRTGVKIEFVPNDEHGQIDINALKRMIDSRVKLISINHIPTGGGLVNPAEEIGSIANAAGVLFLLDACQSAGHVPIDVQAIGCDMLSLTGRKYLRAPRGTGLLYMRKSLLQKITPPTLDQHAAPLISSSEYKIRDDAKRFESWEQNYAGKAAMGVAMDYAMAIGLENIQQRVYALADNLRAQLNKIQGVSHADQGREKCGIVTFQAAQLTPAEIKLKLAEHNINVHVSKGSGNFVLYKQRGIDALVRASLHYYNTNDEIDIFIKTLRKILS